MRAPLRNRIAERRRPARTPGEPRERTPEAPGSGVVRPATAGLPRRLAGPLIAVPALATLSGCGIVTGDGGSPALLTASAAAAVALLGGTAVVVRRVTARPLEKARDQAAQNLGALLEERGGLLAEREAQAAQLRALTGEHRQLLQERDELLRRQQEFAQQWHELAGSHTELSGQRAELHREHQQLLGEQEQLLREHQELIKERDELEGSVDATFVNLAMRTLTLVERQLVLIEALEGREADPAQLESLFRLDHLATRMRRNSENMLLLAGLENSHRSRKTVTLLDVVRAAVSEIERYERVKLGFLAAVRLSGAVADDTSHLLAELLENATAFSPPQDQVEVGGWLLDNGEVMISVADRGIGLPAERLRSLNEQLSEPVEPDAKRRDALLSGALTGRSMGLFVVARLARRHDIRVQLRENGQGGGVTAMVVLPREALQQDPVSTADLDDQRRAERGATAAAAEQARVAAESAVAAEVAFGGAGPAQPGGPGVPASRGQHAARTAGASAAAAPGAGPDLPALPRRKPVERAEQPEQLEEAEQPARVEAVDGLVEQALHAEPAGAAVEAGSSGAEVQPGPAAGPQWAQAQAPDGGDTTSLGLPRRVPSGNGLPGTGETPASGLHRLAVPVERTPAAASPGQTGQTGQTGQIRQPRHSAQPVGRPGGSGDGDPYAQPVDSGVAAGGEQVVPAQPARTSAEELRRRLGGFQSGLRQAAREAAAGGRTTGAAAEDQQPGTLGEGLDR